MRLHLQFFILIKILCDVQGGSPKLRRCLDLNRIAWKSFPPYTKYLNDSYKGAIELIFRQGLRKCCAGELHFNRTFTYQTRDDLTELVMNGTTNRNFDFAFPVQGTPKGMKAIMRPYVPMVESPGSALIVNPDDNAASVILFAVTNNTPLIVIMLLCVPIAGTLFWLIENMTDAYHSKRPERFLRGVGNGIYWAVVTMTTVGYGDKLAHTKGGRIFTVFWVISGVSFCGVFISALTMDLFTAIAPKSYDVTEGKIGVLRSSEEFNFISKKQGTPVEFETIEDMLNALRQKTIESALIDVFIAGNNKAKISEFKIGKIVEIMTSNGAIFLNGGLKYVQCMRNYIYNNQHDILTYVSDNIHVIQLSSIRHSSASLMDPKSSFFRASVAIMFGALIILLVLGVAGQKAHKLLLANNCFQSEEEIFLAQRIKYRLELRERLNDVRLRLEMIVHNANNIERKLQNSLRCFPTF